MIDTPLLIQSKDADGWAQRIIAKLAAWRVPSQEGWFVPLFRFAPVSQVMRQGIHCCTHRDTEPVQKIAASTTASLKCLAAAGDIIQ